MYFLFSNQADNNVGEAMSRLACESCTLDSGQL